MIHLALVLCLLTVVGCDIRTSIPIPTKPSNQPEPSPIPTTSPSPALVIPTVGVGDEVRGKFTGTDLIFDVVAPADGQLVARLSWDVGLNGSLLTFKLEGRDWVRPEPPDFSPLIGRWNVVRGVTYHLVISGGGTDMWYQDQFVLTTRME